jgi:putative peptide zinc metalloprotease protein
MPIEQNERVIVFPFTRRVEGEEITIGRGDGASFLALPAEAVEILDDLASGATLDEAQARYRERHDETPDVMELVETLEAEGFVQRENAESRSDKAAIKLRENRVLRPVGKKYHFSKFPESLAKGIFSLPVFAVGGTLVALAVAAVAADPSFVPGADALFFSERLGLAMLWLVPLLMLQICLHEMAHLVAARARGVPVRFGVGNRLWLLVLETDMSGVWMLPARQRYLPILAGSLLDMATVSGLLLVLAAEHHAYLNLSADALGILRALTVMYLYQIIWQCFLFIRTDFYYAISTFFGCKSLMHDTQVFLRNQWARWTGKGSQIDQSALPAWESRVVRGYSTVWLAGRALAFYLLFFVQVPLIAKYFLMLWRAIVDGLAGRPIPSPVVLVPVIFMLATFGLGMYFWLRSLRPAARPARLDAGAPSYSGEKGA